MVAFILAGVVTVLSPAHEKRLPPPSKEDFRIPLVAVEQEDETELAMRHLRWIRK